MSISATLPVAAIEPEEGLPIVVTVPRDKDAASLIDFLKRMSGSESQIGFIVGQRARPVFLSVKPWSACGDRDNPGIVELRISKEIGMSINGMTKSYDQDGFQQFLEMFNAALGGSGHQPAIRLKRTKDMDPKLAWTALAMCASEGISTLYLDLDAQPKSKPKRFPHRPVAP